MSQHFYSMTGYAEAFGDFEGVRYGCLISSVNSRNLDFRVKVPARLSYLEPYVREAVVPILLRGKVDLQITYDLPVADSGKVSLNKSWIVGFLREAESIINEVGWHDLSSFRPAILTSAFGRPDVFHFEPPSSQEFTTFILSLVRSAMAQYNLSQTREGADLYKAIFSDLDKFKEQVTSIRQIFKSSLEESAQRLRDRFEKLMADHDLKLDESRFYQELLYYLDRRDIAEELVRIESHLALFLQLSSAEADSRRGKKIEYLLQELFREINTIGSKSSVTAITSAVVEAKAALERIREQIQNVC